MRGSGRLARAARCGARERFCPTCSSLTRPPGVLCRRRARQRCGPLPVEPQRDKRWYVAEGPMARGVTKSDLDSGPGDVELSVIVPCYNEEANVPEVVSRVLGVFEAGGFRGEVVLVDDGSSDGTASAIRRAMAASPSVVIGCFHPRNLGIAAGWRTGATTARGSLVATLDADLQYQPEDLLRLRRKLYDRGVDVVQGWRSPVGRERGERYYLSRGFNAILNTTFGMRMRDNKSGFVVCTRDVLLDLLAYDGAYRYWQSFIMVSAHAKGYSYEEVETLFERRRQGTSFLDGRAALATAAHSLVDVAKAVREYRVPPQPSRVATQVLRRHPVSRPLPSRSAAGEARWRGYMATFDYTHWIITKDVERHYESLERSAVVVRAGDGRASGREAAPSRASRVPARALLPRPDAGATPPPRGHPRATRPVQVAALDQGGRPQAPLLRHHVGQPRQGRRAPRHHEWIDGRTAGLLCRSRAARVSLGGDAASTGVDGIPVRRPHRAPVAPDARNVPRSGVAREGRRAYLEPHLHSELRAARRPARRDGPDHRGRRPGAGGRLRRGARLPCPVRQEPAAHRREATRHHVQRADAARVQPGASSRTRSGARSSTSMAAGSSRGSRTSATRTTAIMSSPRGTSSRC